MRAGGLISVVLSITPNCLPLSPLVCHSNFLEGNVERMFPASGDPWRQWCVIPRESSAGYSCFPWIQKTALSQAGCCIPSWRKQPGLSAASTPSRSHPLKPATTFPKYPRGIESSAGPCRLERLDVKYCMQNRRRRRLLTRHCWEFNLCEAFYL